jgi:phosphatidylglycerophosphate synthase
MGGAHVQSTDADVLEPATHPTTSARVQAVVVRRDASANPLRTVGGITLLERLLRQLSELESVDSILLLKPVDLSLPPPSKRVRKEVIYQDTSGATVWEMLRHVRAHLRDRFILVAADLLIDERLLSWLTAQTTEVSLSPRIGDRPEAAAFLRAKSLDAPSLEAARIKVVEVASLPTYWEAMHGDVPFHLQRIRNDDDAEQAWPILLDYIQRRTQELPARYFDPFFENLIVRRLAPSAITANQVTLATTLLGFLVAAFYATGWLRVGVLLAIFVEVLDGVDGKLARITRTTSKAGEYEHILDFFYENSWWLALGFFLSKNGSKFAWHAALLMAAFDLADNIVYSVADVKWHRSVDNATAFLSRFRLVAGRRNIYTWLFLPGFFLSIPGISFYLAVAWAGVTAAIHAAWCINEAIRPESHPASPVPYAEQSVPGAGRIPPDR